MLYIVLAYEAFPPPLGKMSQPIVDLSSPVQPSKRLASSPRNGTTAATQQNTAVRLSTSPPGPSSGAAAPLPPPSPLPVGGLRVLCGSWNVNENLVGLDSLSAWICPTNSNLPAPHVVAVSLQEIVDLKDLKNYVNDDETKNQVVEWGEAIASALKERYVGISFSVMKRVSLVGTCLIVIIQTHLLRYVRDIKKARIATGTFGVLGNKGGCGVRFRLLCNGVEVSICFVGLHLTAHQHEVSKRNQDWDNIISKINFNEQEIQQTKRRLSNQSILGLGEYETGGGVFDHDLVFVMGDLNYRIDADDQIFVLEQIRRRDLAVLLSKDQLINEMRLGHVARGFTEPPINFPPTYKFQPGTSKYETRQEKKKRIPSWCDRILYRAKDESRPVKCERYRACPSLLSSDHKPVSADFYLNWILPPPAPMPSPRAIAASAYMSKARSAIPSATDGASNAPLAQFAIALESINGQSDLGELTIKAGDRLEILSSADSKTILGMIGTGQVGFVPTRALKFIGVFESRAPPEALKQATELVLKRKQQARLRRHHKEQAVQAPLSPPLIDLSREVRTTANGEIVKVVQGGGDEKEGEAEEETDDEYEDDEDDDDEREGAPIVDSGWRRANMDFTARKDDEVSFRAGEMVEILSQESGQDGWWIARVRNFDQGLVPAFCFQAKSNEIHTASSPTSQLISPSSAMFGMLGGPRQRTFSFEELDPTKVGEHHQEDRTMLHLVNGGK